MIPFREKSRTRTKITGDGGWGGGVLNLGVRKKPGGLPLTHRGRPTDFLVIVITCFTDQEVTGGEPCIQNLTTEKIFAFERQCYSSSLYSMNLLPGLIFLPRWPGSPGPNVKLNSNSYVGLYGQNVCVHVYNLDFPLNDILLNPNLSYFIMSSCMFSTQAILIFLVEYRKVHLGK